MHGDTKNSRLYKAQTGQKTEKLNWWARNVSEEKPKKKFSKEGIDWYIKWK